MISTERGTFSTDVHINSLSSLVMDGAGFIPLMVPRLSNICSMFEEIFYFSFA